MVFLGALRPLFLGVEHRGQYEPPQRTEKADVGSRTRQVVLTEPLRFRLGHPMDHSNAAGSPRRFARDANRSRSRMSIDGICVQVRGNVVRVSLARNSIRRTSTKGEAHFCISRVRNAVAPNKKRLRAASNVGETLPLTFAR